MERPFFPGTTGRNIRDSGPAIGTDGTIYFETGDGFLQSRDWAVIDNGGRPTLPPNDTLTLKDYYTPTNHEWLTIRDLDMNVTPSCFLIKGEIYWLARQRRPLFLMDSKSLGGPNQDVPCTVAH